MAKIKEIKEWLHSICPAGIIDIKDNQITLTDQGEIIKRGSIEDFSDIIGNLPEWKFVNGRYLRLVDGRYITETECQRMVRNLQRSRGTYLNEQDKKDLRLRGITVTTCVDRSYKRDYK